MTVVITPNLDDNHFTQIAPGGIQNLLEKTGRLPPFEVSIFPIDNPPNNIPIRMDRFLSYDFSRSVVVPVSTFNCTFVAPDSVESAFDTYHEGDLIALFGNGQQLFTGIIDQVEIETDMQYGEKVTISGRDLMGQLEDQDAVSLDSVPIYAAQIPIGAVATKITKDTRIQPLVNTGCPTIPYLFATEPGESKLAALQRFIEPLNCVAYLSAAGSLVVGKPDFTQSSLGNIVMSKKNRNTTNVMHMKAVKASATIPNFIVPCWTGQEQVIQKISKLQGLHNAAAGPSRLFGLGHRLLKMTVVSTPTGGDAQALSDVVKLQVATGAGNSIDIQAWAKRDFAKFNMKELVVQAMVPGHYNDSGLPYQIDQVYNVKMDRGGDKFEVSEDMYLYQVEYTMGEDSGQRTQLYFCKKGTIVADTKAPGTP